MKCQLCRHSIERKNPYMIAPSIIIQANYFVLENGDDWTISIGESDFEEAFGILLDPDTGPINIELSLRRLL